MPHPQQTTVAPAPAAPLPQTPQAPSQAQLSQQIREQVRKSVEDAKAAAKAARDAARQAKDQSAPVIAPSEGSTSVPPVMPPDVKDLAENVSYAFFFTIVVIAVFVPLIRGLTRRFLAAPQINAVQIPPQLTDQILRIEHAVESMAIEIERISESQRFLTKLQAGKAEQAALPRQGS
jgi:hypothetical protein